MSSRRHRYSQSLLLLFCHFVVIVALSSCGARFEAKTPASSELDPTQTTGARFKDGRFMTSASDDGELNTLKEQIDVTQGQNRSLAEGILSAQVLRFDKNLKPATDAPARLRVQLSLKKNWQEILPPVVKSDEPKGTPLLPPASTDIAVENLNLIFEADLLKLNEKDLGFEFTPSKEDPLYRLQARCLDSICERVVLRLNHLGSERSPRSQAGLIVRFRQAEIEQRLPSKSKDQMQASKFLGTIAERGLLLEADIESTEVAWGLSSFRLNFISSQISFCLTGLYLQTNELDETLELSCVGESQQELFGTKSVSASLIGNNTRGGLIVRLADGELNLLMVIQPKTNLSQTKPAEPEKLPEPAVPPALDPSLPRLTVEVEHPITRAWEADRTRPDLKVNFQEWTGIQAQRVANFLVRIQPNRPLLEASLRESRIPNDFLVITLIESNFFVTPGYPIQTNSKSTAVGPWQFLEGTGRGLGLKVLPYLPGRKADPCDERADLEASTRAAGRYLRILLDEFPADPRLAVMSYYWGQGNVDRTLDRLQKEKGISPRLQVARDAGLDYWTVRAFNMAPKSAIDYVARFVSAKFIAREPERYGLDAILRQTMTKLGQVEPAPKLCQTRN